MKKASDNKFTNGCSGTLEQPLLFIVALFLCVLSVVPLELYAQDKDTTQVQNLQGVRVTGNRKPINQPVNIGTRVSQIENVVLRQNIMNSLGDVLAENSTVYIKSLGQGAMSTSSFRGTSSAHTQVLWNGIRINPAMSTSFDFSQMPVFFMDNVKLFHGNSSVKGGSGALGGTVSIGNNADFTPDKSGQLFFEYGSCDTYSGAVAIKAGGNRIVSKTKLFIQGSDNDFKYLNKVYSINSFYERRKESRYFQAGAMQELYYKLGKHSKLTANVWYQYGNRRLPQPIIVAASKHENQKENNVRSFLSYDYSKDVHSFSVKVAYLYSSLYWKQWYSSAVSNESTTKNFSNSVQAISEYTYTPHKFIKWNTQLSYIRDWVDATSYSVKEACRDAYSLQSNLQYSVNDRLSFQVQGMVELNSTTNKENTVFPTFSAAAYYYAAQNLQVKGNVSYNYKFPSMNDLYWQPGGDETLMPEKGFSYDLGLAYNAVLADNISVNAEVTGYFMNISDWIMWLPNADSWYWCPKNLKKVKSYGVESSAGLNCQAGEFDLKFNINYTFSRAHNSGARFSDDATASAQLPYIPKHKANFRVQASWRNIVLSYNINYIGRRYTTEDESYYTTDYTIHNAALWYTYKFTGKLYLMPKITVTNLFNTYYESTQYYPMPMRMIHAGVVFGF